MPRFCLFNVGMPHSCSRKPGWRTIFSWQAYDIDVSQNMYKKLAFYTDGRQFRIAMTQMSIDLDIFSFFFFLKYKNVEKYAEENITHELINYVSNLYPLCALEWFTIFSNNF